MISTLSIHNIGPIADLAFTIGDGLTTVSGPSGAGKSHIPRVYLAAIHGGQIEARDGADGGRVVARTGRGATVVLDAGKTTTRRVGIAPETVTRAGSVEDGTRLLVESVTALLPEGATDATKAKVAAAVRAHVRPEAAAVVDPSQLAAMINTPTRRELTDYLARIVPVNLEGSLTSLMTAAGYEVRATDPRHAKGKVGGKDGADVMAREANRVRDTAAGTLTEARRAALAAADALEGAPAPDAAELARAREAEKALAAWADYDRQVTAWQAAETRRTDAQARLDVWDEATKAAGERPAYDPAEHHRTRTAIGEARAAAAKAEREAAKAEARREVEAERPAPPAPVAAPLFTPSTAAPVPTTTCPECGHRWSPNV